MAITIRDVAQLAGVSPSTVSRTCNNHPSISTDTKEKVRAAIEQLGYVHSSSTIRSQKQENHDSKRHIKRMGVILTPSNLSNYENSFNMRALHSISLYCNRNNYSNTVISGETSHDILHNVKHITEYQDVDGFIILYSIPNDPVAAYLEETDLPYVIIGKAATSVQNTIYVDNDNLLAGQEATDYLFKLNHKKIAFIGYEPSFLFSFERQSGYQLSILQHGMTINPDYIVTDCTPPLTELCTVAKLLQDKEHPTGLVVADDTMAVAVIQLCYKLGLNVPNDISIIAFNNSLISVLTAPQLTSIDVNSSQLGSAAAAQLAENIEIPGRIAKKIIVPHQLIERQSATWLDN